jgi:hypothetical protein
MERIEALIVDWLIRVHDRLWRSGHGRLSQAWRIVFSPLFRWLVRRELARHAAARQREHAWRPTGNDSGLGTLP